MRRKAGIFLCASAAAAFMAAPAGAATSNVNMQNISYQPATVTISVGDSVAWHNLDTVPHTVTADDGSSDSMNVAPGTSYSRAFTQPGNFTYHCNIHSNMHGTVMVQGGGPAPTQAPPPTASPSPQPAPAAAPAPTPAPHTPAASTTTAAPTTTSSPTTTLAPPAAADAGTTSSTTAAAGGGVALPASQKTSSGGGGVSPWLAALAVVLALGAAAGGVVLRRRMNLS